MITPPATKARSQHVQGSNSFDATSTPSMPISGMDLWDLVQVNCLSGARRVVQVGCGASWGHLYFCGGQVVHATLGNLVGDEAALVILQHRGASCALCTSPFPGEATVRTAWQGLLLRAAQLLDEAARGDGAQVAAGAAPSVTGVRRLRNEVPHLSKSPADAKDFEDESEIEFWEESEDLLVELDENEQPVGVPTPVETLEESEYRQLAWIDRGGQVVQEVGAQIGFADAAAYAVQMSEVIGNLLSLGSFVGLECQQGSGSRFVYADGEGGIVACEPALGGTAAMLRRRLAL